MASTPAAVGFRAHSGWAAAVAVAGSPSRPQILDRRRIEIADRSIEGSVQPYHAAEEMPFPKAKSFLKRCETASARLARRAVDDLVSELKAKGCDIVGGGLLLASGRPLPELASVLASHALIHTADGEHFRAAILDACEHAGLGVLRVREREISKAAARRFRMADVDLTKRIAEAGKPIGSPWTVDQKLAALVAWLALAEL